jgi:L-ascorbate metabolism protein UlaG (beta-lactamase superfamily)
MSTSVRFLGVAGFEIVGPSHRVVVDPFLDDCPGAAYKSGDVERPDVILVTHAAFDHLGDAAKIARRTKAPVVCGGDVRLMLLDQGVPDAQIMATIWGVVVRVAGLEIRPVECKHWSNGQLSSGERVWGTPLAFIFETEPGVRFYHYGDSAVFDMSLIGRLYQPTVGFLGCTQPVELPEEGPGEVLTGEMTPGEAALAAEMLGLKVAVVCHYISKTPHVQEFLDAVPQLDTTGQRRVIAPDVGEMFVIDPSELGGTDSLMKGARS